MHKLVFIIVISFGYGALQIEVLGYMTWLWGNVLESWVVWAVYFSNFGLGCSAIPWKQWPKPICYCANMTMWVIRIWYLWKRGLQTLSSLKNMLLPNLALRICHCESPLSSGDPRNSDRECCTAESPPCHEHSLSDSSPKISIFLRCLMLELC